MSVDLNAQDILTPGGIYCSPHNSDMTDARSPSHPEQVTPTE
jgi:hypothetical protein